ncbi:pyrroline-5-carboxylate reductase [Variovorax paradoxus]|uniref:pyrroline-5-carboxylate reductase n=1 Tax=Variovorax paradoxus TaxID=34073 RepID=UPI0029C967A9|nr:pyrroline-5-carboxylate reductase [Variovorax paradoxus]
MKILFLGYGNMGRAMGDAWKASPDVSEVLAIDPVVQGRDGVFATMGDFTRSHSAAEVGLVVLAVKPAMAGAVLKALPVEFSKAALLSVAAGVTIDVLATAAPPGMAVLRAMPNTPAMLRAGCTGVFASPQCSVQVRAQIEQLLAAVGAVHWLDSEAQIDMVTAVSGSGPAYYHLFSEALADAGVSAGLPAELARSLAAATAWGAAHQQHQPDADFAALRKAVTSPNGTTAAAIAVFEESGALRALVTHAVASAWQRAIELSRPT